MQTRKAEDEMRKAAGDDDFQQTIICLAKYQKEVGEKMAVQTSLNSFYVSNSPKLTDLISCKQEVEKNLDRFRLFRRKA